MENSIELTYTQQLISLQKIAEEERTDFKEHEIDWLEKLCFLRKNNREQYLSLREDLERYYYKQVIELASKYKYKETQTNDFEDFISQGLIGLYIAFDKYDSEYKTTLLTFGKRYIQNELDKQITKTLGLHRNDYFRLLKLKTELYKINEDSHSIEPEIIQSLIKEIFKLKTDSAVLRTYSQLSGYLDSFVSISLETSEGDEDSPLIIDTNLQVDPISEYMETSHKKELIRIIIEELDRTTKYNSRNSDILKMRLNYLTEQDKDRISDYLGKEFPILREHSEGYTLKEIGDYFGLTRERVRQLESRFFESLKQTDIYKYT